jgi:hypothetical protein
VRSTDLHDVIDQLTTCKSQQNLHGEIKWQKVTEQYLEKYIAVVDTLFDLTATNRLKLRVMFTNNTYVPKDLSAEQRKTEYQRLYYQFIKHAFGLQYSLTGRTGPAMVRLNIDQMPVSREDAAQFKSFLLGLNKNSSLRAAKIHFDPNQIAEVESQDHVILQCLDVILGSIAYRLNDKHLEKIAGTNRRGKRTIAKEKLYRHILSRIRQVYPNFNIGETTGLQNDITNRWQHPYRHWKLIPKDHERDLTRAKP